MRVIGLDLHRVFAEAAALEDGRLVRLGRIDLRRDQLAWFAGSLAQNDHVVIEATGNAAAVAEVLRPHVGRVIVANPKQVRLIAHAKIKTDTGSTRSFWRSSTPAASCPRCGSRTRRRASHFRTVRTLTPAASAARAALQPNSRTRRTIRARP
jgi:hypothetical protein